MGPWNVCTDLHATKPTTVAIVQSVLDRITDKCAPAFAMWNDALPMFPNIICCREPQYVKERIISSLPSLHILVVSGKQ